MAHLKAHANAYAERFVRSIKRSYLDRIILFGERSLRSRPRLPCRIITVNETTKVCRTALSIRGWATLKEQDRSLDETESVAC
jgi:hypothetical protein